MITITSQAKQHLESVAQSNNTCLRIVVTGGGCSGFQYHFEPVQQPLPNDVVIDDVAIIDPISLQYLEGATLDLKQDAFSSYLTLRVAQGRSQCGCGSSFGM